MLRPLRSNWTRQWLTIGAVVVLAPIAWSADGITPRVTRQSAEQDELGPRWRADTPWPLTSLERKVAASKVDSWFDQQRRNKPVTPGVVSLKQLKNPISKQDVKLLEGAQEDLKEGRREAGLQKLQAALERPETGSYANAILGVEHLKVGEYDAAVKLLSESSLQLPNNASIHAHLAFSLAALGRTEFAEDETRRALALDPQLHGAEYLLGVLLLNDPRKYAESVQCLRAAQSAIPAAGLALAVLHASSGEMQRMHDVLKSAGFEDARFEQWAIAAAALPHPAAAFGVHARDE